MGIRGALAVVLIGCACSYEPIGLDPTRSSGDAGGPGRRCGQVSNYSDDFEDGVTGSAWQYRSFQDPGTTSTEIGGNLVLTLLPNGVKAYAGYFSTFGADLRGDVLEVELVEGPPSGSSVQAFLTFQYEADNKLQFLLERGVLSAYEWVDNGFGERYVVDFDPVAHRYWRMAGEGDAVAFEVSADRIDWTRLGTAPSPPYAGYGNVQVGAGSYTAEAGPIVVRFDNLNPARAAMEWCSVNRLQDDFGPDGVGAQWTVRPRGSGCVEPRPGGAGLSVVPDAGVTCSLLSRTAWSLAEGELRVQVSERPTAAGVRSGVELFDGVNAVASLVFVGATVVGIWNDPALTTFESIADAGYTWLRLRQKGAMVHFAASGDGDQWVPVLGVSTSRPTGMLGVRLIVDGENAALAGVETAVFGSVNPGP